ncbi:MAG TPA: Yip1 family protein [Caulobacteraceae bacterium]|jgi:hypothetical protein
MSVVEAPKPQGLVARIIGILTRPRAEWEIIGAEAATTQGLFLRYAVILAAIPALARIVSGLMPRCLFGVCVTPNPMFVIVGAVVSYVLSLVCVFIAGLIIDALAPSFGGEKSQVQAMKVAVYSWTAAWLAGVFLILPWVGLLLSLLGLYSFYLLYTGLGTVMKSPGDRSVVYTIVVVLISIVLYFIVNLIAGSMMTIGALSAGVVPGSQVSGTLHFGDGSVDLGKLQRSAQAAADQMKAQQSGGPGKVDAVDPEKLKALLPDTVGGAPRTDVTASSAGAAGFGASDAEATYQKGDVRVTVKVTDLAAAGSFAAMAGAMHVQTDRQTPTGYEKVSTVNGQLITEKYDNQARSGEYTVIVANRFSIDADGSGIDMQALKAAVAAVGPDRLAALAPHS